MDKGMQEDGLLQQGILLVGAEVIIPLENEIVN